jgi:hypothetical protein
LRVVEYERRMGKTIETLRVKLDKPFYIAGEEVTGVLYLSCLETLEMEEIYIKAKGKELVQWDETHQGKDTTYDEKEGFFKKKIRVTCRSLHRSITRIALHTDRGTSRAADFCACVTQESSEWRTRFVGSRQIFVSVLVYATKPRAKERHPHRAD